MRARAAIRSRADLIFEVSAALVLGAILVAPAFTVGPFKEATVEELRFACLDLRGRPLHSFQVEEHATSLYTKDTAETQDWTSFGAARAFVDAVGVKGAIAALKKARR